uniref:Uncharacterized protein n=1 Tax=Arundo donax TaxID=35708 RepID=A0A0A9H844_ARUDO
MCGWVYRARKYQTLYFTTYRSNST